MTLGWHLHKRNNFLSHTSLWKKPLDLTSVNTFLMPSAAQSLIWVILNKPLSPFCNNQYVSSPIFSIQVEKSICVNINVNIASAFYFYYLWVLATSLFLCPLQQPMSFYSFKLLFFPHKALWNSHVRLRSTNKTDCTSVAFSWHGLDPLALQEGGFWICRCSFANYCKQDMAEVNTGNTHPPNILGFQLIFSGVGGLFWWVPVFWLWLEKPMQLQKPKKRTKVNK